MPLIPDDTTVIRLGVSARGALVEPADEMEQQRPAALGERSVTVIDGRPGLSSIQSMTTLSRHSRLTEYQISKVIKLGR